MSAGSFYLIVLLSVVALAYRRLWLRSVEREERWERIIDREVWLKVAAMAAGATVHPGTGKPKGSAGDCTSGGPSPEALEVGNDTPACGSREARRHPDVSTDDTVSPGAWGGSISVYPVNGEGVGMPEQAFRAARSQGERRG